MLDAPRETLAHFFMLNTLLASIIGVFVRMGVKAFESYLAELHKKTEINQAVQAVIKAKTPEEQERAAAELIRITTSS